jgi:hypothetical protein
LSDGIDSKYAASDGTHDTPPPSEVDWFIGLYGGMTTPLKPHIRDTFPVEFTIGYTNLQTADEHALNSDELDLLVLL